MSISWSGHEGLQFTNWLADIFPRHIGELGVPDLASDPMASYRYHDGRRMVIQESAKQRPGIRIADKNIDVMIDLVGERSCMFEELVADTGTAELSIRYDHPLTDWMIHETKDFEDLHLIIDPIPTQPSWRTRWGGKITEIDIVRDNQGIHKINIKAASMREHAKKLLFGANPIFPPEVQLPKMWILPGPTRTILAVSMFINLARIFSPILSIPTNIFNPAGWINPLGLDAVLNIDPLNWPLQVQFINPLLDQSRWSVLGATWTDWNSAMGQLLIDAGVIFRAYTWMKEDLDSPHQEIADTINAPLNIFGSPGLGDSLDNLIRPRRNCVVFALEDKSGRTGPTGTLFDGLLNLIGVSLDQLTSPILVNIDTGQKLDGMPVVDAAGRDQSNLISSMLGVAPEIPRVIWWEGDYNGIVESGVTIHKGPVKTAMTGGRSPSIINQAQTFAIRYALAQLSAVINYVIGAYQQPGTPGLDNLYQGQLDNVLFAWQRFTEPLRALHTGDFAYNEVIERGSGTAYTLASVVTLRAGLYRTRSYTGFVVKVMNGKPHMVDVDIRLGDRAGFEEDGVIYVDQITAIKREWDRDRPITVGLAIGDDKDKEDPFAGYMRMLAAMWSMLGSFLGEGTIFG